MKNLSWLSICTLILVTAVVAQRALSKEHEQAGNKWEYKTIYVYAESDGPAVVSGKLNQLGDEGWELASMALATDRYTSLAVFKRRK